MTCSITNGTSDFSIDETQCPDEIAGGAQTTITVAFTPSTRGGRTGNLRIQGQRNGSAFTVNVALSGTGIAPQMVVTVVPDAPSPIDFGTAPAETASATTFTFRVANNGDDVLTAQLTEGGTNPGDWTYAPAASPFQVAAGEARDIAATFTPGAIGNRSATVTITDATNLSTTPTRSFNLTGVGTDPVAISVSAESLDFGSVDVQGGEPSRRTVTFTNPGSQTLRLTDIHLETADGQEYDGTAYTVTATSLNVPAGDTGGVEVTYQPSVESAEDTAVLALTTNVVATPAVAVDLTGRGLDRHIQVTPERIDFQPTYRNPLTPPAETLLVENTGDVPLLLSAGAPEGEGAASFRIDGELPGAIEPGQSASVDVAFVPGTAETFAASLVLINDDDARPMVRIDLSGTGLVPPVSANLPSVNWGSVAVGLELPPPQALTIRNGSDDTPFDIREVRVVDPAGQAVEAFRVGTASLELEPGGERALDVLFAPRESGTFTGTLEVFVGEDEEPIARVDVRGEAVETDARGGAGCSAAPGRSPTGWWIAACGLALLARRRRRMAALLLVLASAAAGGTASAQAASGQDVDLTSFRPVHTVEPALVTVESNDVGRAGRGALGVTFDYARNPLVLRSAGGDVEMTDHPVSSRSTTELAGAFAFGGRYEVSAAVPFLMQSGDAPRFSAVAPADGSGLGDVRLHGKALLASFGPARLGASAEVTLPTAGDEPFSGTDGPSGLGRALFDYRVGPVLVALNGGAVVRKKVRLADVEQGSQAVYGAGAAVQLTPRWQGVAELFGSASLSGTAGARPLEAAAAARYRLSRELAVLVGAGRGVMAGIGAPEVRMFVAIGWSSGARPIDARDDDPRALTDDDGDGVVKRDDRCPDELEDLDDFEDDDGCPDRDDDQDGVPDASDRCPRKAEDKDGFADEDGCPDKDNDGDRVLDENDACPLQAEDPDGFEDQNGCPDPDNDSDGVLDRADRCATEKETINGNKDEDGCPDAGEGAVLVTADKLEILEPIRFRGDGATLIRSSQRVLGQVAATLRAHREIGRLRIRAHVQRRGARDDELSKARAEAVRRFLIDWGISPDRVEAVGLGSSEQLLSGSGARARAMNDRIELEIVDRRRR